MRNLFVLILLLIGSSSFGSNTYLNKRSNIKIHYSESDYLFGQGFIITHLKNTPRFSAETNYSFFDFLEAGFYLGFSTYDKMTIVENSEFLASNNMPIFFYGINTNLHFLPLLIKKDDFWLDLYFSSKLGSMAYIGSKFPTVGYAKKIEYGFYGGIALYPGKHWGLFYEYGKGNYIDSRFGLSFKL